MKYKLTQERLKELLHYDPETGVFIWLVDIRTGKNNAFLKAERGERAGWYGSYGYRYISIDAQKVAEHRAAWVYMTGAALEKKDDIDHINGIRDDNRWRNIRKCDRSFNMQNMKKAHKDSETGFLGVEKKRDKYAARICIRGERKNLGVYDTPEEAHQAYLKAKRKYHEGCTI